MTYVVCGWYTPDYAGWARRLEKNLNEIGHTHDFVEVAKAHGGWEANTMMKPLQIAAAMDRHPGETIVFLDVDCEVLKPLHDLAAIKGDVGVHMRAKAVKGGIARLSARSGTMVFKPTPAAYALVNKWASLCRAAPKGSVDQRTLPMAIAMTFGLSLDNLDVKFCAVANDKVAEPVILHDSASKETPKIHKLVRRAYAVLGVRVETSA